MTVHDTKNAAPGVAAPKSGGGKQIACAGDPPTSSSITALSNLLPRGEENAIPARQLAEMFGLEDTRDVRKLISIERERTVILSAARRGGGYFLPDAGAKGKSEIACFLAMMDARKRHNNRVTETARKALREIDGQQAIEEDDGGGGEKDS